MSNNKWREVPMRGRLRKAYFAGWTDAKLRLPWSTEFDHDNSLQEFYEAGRLERMNIEAACISIVWDGGQDGVDRINDAVRVSEIQVGQAVPPDFRERVPCDDR